MKKRLLLMGCVLVMSAGIAACSSGNKSAEATVKQTGEGGMQTGDDTDDMTDDMTDEEKAILNTKKMPEFTAKTTEGEEVTNEIFKESKLTVVNLWGSWCQPCVEEIPDLQKLYENMKDKGVNVIGVAQDGDSDIDAVKEVIEKDNVTYKNLVPEGKLKDFVMSSQFFPVTFLVDSEGNIVGNVSGGNSLESFTKAVEEALAKIG